MACLLPPRNTIAWVALPPSSAGRHPLRSDATRIGRLSDNDIVIDDDTVSRYHAVIVATGNSFVVTDLRSANGVEMPGSPSKSVEVDEAMNGGR